MPKLLGSLVRLRNSHLARFSSILSPPVTLSPSSFPPSIIDICRSSARTYWFPSCIVPAEPFSPCHRSVALPVVDWQCTPTPVATLSEDKYLAFISFTLPLFHQSVTRPGTEANSNHGYQFIPRFGQLPGLVATRPRSLRPQ